MKYSNYSIEDDDLYFTRTPEEKIMIKKNGYNPPPVIEVVKPTLPPPPSNQEPEPDIPTMKAALKNLEARIRGDIFESGVRTGQLSDVAIIRAALFDVIDGGENPRRKWAATNPHEYAWLFWCDETDEQTALRMRFADRVIARIEELKERGL